MTHYDYVWRTTLLIAVIVISAIVFSLASAGNVLALITVTSAGVIVIMYLAVLAIAKLGTLFFTLNSQENTSLLAQQADSIKLLGAANKTLTSTARDLNVAAQIKPVTDEIHSSWDDLSLPPSQTPTEQVEIL